MQPTATYWIEHLGLARHIEGGYYKRTYTAPFTTPTALEPGQFPDERAFSSAIYFLLEHGDFSAFHRIRSDEMWHFYSGDPLHIYEIKAGGELQVHRLGNCPEKGTTFQALIPGGS